MHIATVAPAQIDDVARFAAALNAAPEHHIGYFDAAPEGVAQTMRGAAPPPEQGWFVARAGGDIVGLLGVEADADVGRAWLYGPLVSTDDWEAVADALYAAALPAIPAGVFEQELFCDARNTRVQAFAQRHEIPLHSEAAILAFERARLAALPLTETVALTEPYVEQFRQLHAQTFPRGYYTADQILARVGPRAPLLAVSESGALLGYLFAQVSLEGEAGIDFVGVAEGARRRGVGRRLVVGALHRLFALPEVSEVALNVNTANVAAIRLYESTGFFPERTMRAFRGPLPNTLRQL